MASYRCVNFASSRSESNETFVIGGNQVTRTVVTRRTTSPSGNVRTTVQQFGGAIGHDPFGGVKIVDESVFPRNTPRIVELDSDEKQSTGKTDLSSAISNMSSDIDQIRESFTKKVVEEMNEHRRKHQVAPLRMSEKLNRYAQEWADYLAQNNKFCHRELKEYGENLAMGTGNAWSNAVSMWYNEAKSYDYNSGRYVSRTGHFTQIVWKSSEEVGIGIARSPTTGSTVVVANFNPAGNVLGHFKENVFPPQRTI